MLAVEPHSIICQCSVFEENKNTQSFKDLCNNYFELIVHATEECISSFFFL